MFTPSKFFKSVAGKVTGRRSTPPNGVQASASPASPVAAARGTEQESPVEADFASPTQDIAISQQGTPDDAVTHGKHTSAMGLLQLGSVLAGAAPLQREQSVTTPREPDVAQEWAIDMPAPSQQAIVQISDSWPSQAAKFAQQYALPPKRSAVDDAVDTFLQSRQAKRQRTAVSGAPQASDRQLASYSTGHSSPKGLLQLPAPMSPISTPVHHSALALPLPSPKPAAPSALPPRGQGLPGLSRFSKQAPPSNAFAMPTQGRPAMAASLTTSANPFAMGSDGKRRQDTPRFHQHKSARSRLGAARGGRSPLMPSSARKAEMPTFPKFSFGGVVQQQPALQGSQSPIPKAIFPVQHAPFGSPLPAAPPSRQAAPSPHAQQALVLHPTATPPLISQQNASAQQASGLGARQSVAALSSVPTDASESGSGQSARQGGATMSWTPMKASADLPHSALVDKLTKGKQLTQNSLIGAGLDPSRLAGTPRPHNVRRFKGVTPKRKVDELGGPHDQNEAPEEQGRHKQVKTAQPVASQQPHPLPSAPPPTTLLGFAPSPAASTPSSHPAGHGPSNAQEAANAGVADQTANADLASAAQEAQPKKDYGAAWVAAATKNDEATASPSADAADPLEAASPPFQSAALKGRDPTAQGSLFAPSPSSTPPKQRSSLTDSLTKPAPSFPKFALLPSTAAASSPSQATPTVSLGPSMFASPLPTQSTPPPASLLASPGFTPIAAAATAPWTITSGQTPLPPWGTSPQTSQQEPAEEQRQQPATSRDLLTNATPMVNGPSKQADDTADNEDQQVASTSSDGSGDTVEERLYPFPTHRSAQDRLEGIVSSSAYHEEDLDNQYVFGRQQRTLADQNVLSSRSARGIAAAPAMSSPADENASAVHQDEYLSPGEARRLHAMSSAVPLPSPGESEPDMHLAVHDDTQANGTSKTADDSDGAASDADWVQTTASAGGSGSRSHDSSDVSEISGMGDSDDGSVAPTEVVEEDEQDATVAIGAHTPASGWDLAFLQKHSAAAQEAAAAAADAVKHSSDQEAQAGSAPQLREAAERSQTPEQAVSPEILPHGADAGHLAEIKQEALPPLGLEKPSQVENSKLAQPAVPDTAAMPGPAGTGTALHASAGLWQNAQPTFPASKPLSRVFMQAIDAPLPDDAPEPTALPAPDPIAPQEAAEGGTHDTAGDQKPRRRVKVRRNR